MQISGEYHELPEFLRFNKYGGVLDKQERERVARTKGVCSRCGKTTHKVTPFRNIPLDNDQVSGGVCLKCHPEHRKISIDAPPPVKASGKAAKLLGGHGQQVQEPDHDLVAAVGAKNIAKKLRARVGHLPLPDSPSFRNEKKSTDDIAALVSATRAAKHIRRRSRNISNNHDRKKENDNNVAFQRLGSIDPFEPQPTINSQSERPLSNKGRRSTMNKQFHSTPINPLTSSALRDDVQDHNNDAWDLVKEMRSHPDDVELLTRKCDELRNIGRNQSGSLYEIIEIMRRFPREISLQIAAIGVLWSLSADGGHDSKMEVLEAGGAEVIIEALSNFPEDVKLLSWGLGALSNLGEGMGGRSYLEEEGVLKILENTLKNFCETKGNGREVFYWILRCLVTLVCEYSDVNMDISAFDLNDTKEDFEVTERNRNGIADSDIIHMVLLAINTAPMDAIALEMAFKFLSHFDVENYTSENRDLLTEACEEAIRAKPHSACTTLHHLACATQCLAMIDSTSECEDCAAPNAFVSVALDVFTYHARKHNSSISIGSSSFSIGYDHPHSVEVMVFTLSHLLCFGNTTMDIADSKHLLKSCCSILEYDDSSGFVQGSCCWIIWSIFRYGPCLIKNTSIALAASEAILRVVPGVEYSPNLLAVGFAALSEVTQCINLKANALAETIVRLVSKYPDEEILCIEACQLLINLCKTKKIAAHMVSAGGLDLVENPLDGSNKLCQMKVHLMIKFSINAGDHLPIEHIEAMINACVRLKSSSPLAAKSWLGFLVSSMTPNREDFTQRAPMAMKSIYEILEAFPKNENLQKYACLALKNISVLIQQAGLSLDTSTAITAVLAAQKEHGVKIHKECCDALWALMGVECQLEPALIREIVYFAIEVTEIHVISSEYTFSDDIVAAGMAIFANTIADPSNAMLVLGEKIVDIIVDVVNTTIYSSLDKGANNQFIFEFGFCTLRRLCYDDSSRDIIVSHGGIVAVIDGMMANLENASIQENGCHILRRLAGDVLEMKLNVVEADGVDVIMNIMMSHSENASVLSEAFHALSCISVDKASRNFIAQQGGIMLVANSMSSLSDSAVVQEAGLAALCNLASDVDEGMLQASNVFVVVNNSLNCHAENSSIQRKGLALFYNLSMRSEGIQNELVSSGCLKNVVTAMEIHTRDPNIVSSALRMLVNLSDTGEGMQVILEERVIKLIVNAIMLHVEDLKIAIVGCKTVHVIHDKSMNTISIGVGGVEAIVYLMMFHHSSEYVQGVGCCTLSHSFRNSFMSNDGTFDAELFDLKCKMMEVLLSALLGFPESFEVQKKATFALERMSKYEENVPILLTEQSRLEGLLINTMACFPTCQKSCRDVLNALA